MRKNFILAVMLFLVCFVFIGCCDSNSYDDYIVVDSYSVPVSENGGLNEVSRLGVTLSAPENTFASNKGIIIVITESEGQGTEQLSLASKVYTIRAYTEDGKEVTTTDKPVSLRIVNSVSPEQESYMGICENNSWHYSCLNSPSNSCAIRASKAETLQIYKFGISAAVFVRNPGADSTAVVSDADVANKKIEVRVDEDKFYSDMPIELVMECNTEAMGMNQSDFLINIRYQNENKNDVPLSVTGGSAQITTDRNEQSAFDGQIVHKITVSDVTPRTDGHSIVASFALNLNGKYIKDFAKKFTIDVANSPKSQRFESIPFQYSTSVDIVDAIPASEPVPLPPADINVEPSEITPDSVIRIVWKPSQNAVGYKLVFENTSSGTEQEFDNITGIEWTSEDSGLNLTEGNYRIIISSKNSEGVYCEPYVVSEFNIPLVGEDSLTTPVLNDFAPVYPINSKVAVLWQASVFTSASGETGEVKYDVYVDTVENPVVKYKEDISETECSIIAENITSAGVYYVKVVAKHGDMTATSEIKSFEAKSSALANPVISGIQTKPYATGNKLEIAWEPIADPFENPIKYAIKLYSGDTIPEASTEENITATSWSKELTEAGNFKIVVIADNGNGQTSQSAPVAFEVKSPVLATPVIAGVRTEPYATGNKLEITWEPIADPFENPIKYAIKLYSGDTIPEASTEENITATNWSKELTEAGNFKIVVIADNGNGQTSQSAPVAFEVVGVPEKPELTVTDIIAYGEAVNVSWNACANAESYDVFVYKDGEAVPENAKATITDTSCNIKDYITEPGLYNVFVVAKAKVPTLTNKSDEKQIKLLETPATPINIVLSDKQPGQMLSAQWEAGNEAAEVTYHVALVKDSVVVSTGDTSALTWTDTNALSIGSYEFSVSAENAAGVSASATVNFDVIPNTVTVKVADYSLIESKTKLIPVIQVVFDYAITDECKSLFEGKYTVASTGAALTYMIASWSEDVASPTLNISFDDYLEPMTTYYVAFASDLISDLETNYGITFNNLTSGKFEFTTVLWEGTGTNADPYQVLFPIQITEIKDPYLDCSFTQLRDIDFANALIESIGVFEGKYNGRGYAIKNFRIDCGEAGTNVALFSQLASTGELTSIYLNDIYVKGLTNVAGLCGTNNGAINDCFITGYIDSEMYYAEFTSGLVAINNNIIASSAFIGEISGYQTCAGLVACNNSEGVIRNSYASSTVTAWAGNFLYTGGLVGRNGGLIEKCHTTGWAGQDPEPSESTSYSIIGGIVGENKNTGILRNCYAKNQTVCSSVMSGGICGVCAGTISNCYATGLLKNGSYDHNDGSNANRGIVGKESGTALSVTDTFIAGNFSVSNYPYDAGNDPTLFPPSVASCFTNCVYLAAGYESGIWTSDWDSSIWEIPTGSFTKDNPCLPKLKGVGGQD